MHKLDLGGWSDFEGALQQVNDTRQERTARSGRPFRDPLFRGVGSSKWGLETTLERSYPSERCDATASLLKYYRKIGASKPAIETFSGRRWDRLPEFPEFEKLVKDNFSTYTWLDILLMHTPDICEYLVYLRSDPRHLLQQCRYSMCAAVDLGKGDYLFRPHQSGLSNATGPEGELFEITMPVEERLAALKHLDLMNINAFSLFGSDDSLVRTIARRELLFRDWP